MKSLFFPGGRNCKLSLIFSLVAILAAQASAAIITEDFEDVTESIPPSFSTDGVLNHFIYDLTLQPASSSLWDIDSFNTAGDDFNSNSLVLRGAQDIITFTLGQNEYIESVTVELINNTLPSTVIIEGENSTYYEDFFLLRTNILIDTTGMGLGSIERITLFGFDAAFDNLNVSHVVPEPMTITLLGFGGMMLRKRKRS